jgi:hypothetical protein
LDYKVDGFLNCCRRRCGARRGRIFASNFRKLPRMSDGYQDAGEARSAWVADYFDQHRKRHEKTFPT